MTETPFLVLDFDGVICDSTEECVVTAWNAWQSTRPIVRTPAEVPEPFRSTLRRYRSYVRTAGEYLILIEAARAGRAISSQADYQKLFEEFRPKIKPYGDLFFASRNRLRAEDERHWLDLHTVYAGMTDALHRVWQAFEVFVVTGKDSSSVQRFFESFHLPISPSRIYDKDAAHDKLAAIRMIAAGLRRTLDATLFIDDNVHHLLAPSQAGCHVFMAGWGYHTDEQIRLAKDQSIPILKLESWTEIVEAVYDRQGAHRAPLQKR